MHTILHIAPHLGGGAGTVISILIDEISKNKNWQQELICFESLNGYARQWSKKTNIEINENITADSQWLHDKISNVDIVHYHYWNHPATSLFMHAFKDKLARMVFWSHPNGCHIPYQFNSAVLQFPELFCIASKYSLKAKAIKQQDKKWQIQHLRYVFSCAGTNNFENTTNKKHSEFCIGYIGTVDYCKMHRNFISICKNLNIPNLKVIVCGGEQHQAIAEEAKIQAPEIDFHFLGKVKNVRQILAQLDLFIYPLAKGNYGTGEQVLIEAMSAGVPQIVLDNSPEAYVIKNNVTGLIANDTKDFIQKTKLLYTDKNYRLALSKQSKEYACQNYNIDTTVDNWLHIYQELLTRPKKKHHFNLEPQLNYTLGINLFLQALGNCQERDIYLKAIKYYPNQMPQNIINKLKQLPIILQSKTRGSIKHYNSYFNDTMLQYVIKNLE